MLIMLAATLLCQTLDKDYIPMKQGTKWVYKEGSDEHTTELTGSVTLASHECVIAAFTTAGKPLSVIKAYRIGDEGLLECGATIKLLELSPWNETKPPEIVLKFGTKKGDRWEHKSGFRSAVYEHAGEEELTVPAGTFKTIKITLSETWDNAKDRPALKTSRSYARGVGIVREESTKGGTLKAKELKSFFEGK
jgi:hypothetical protein